MWGIISETTKMTLGQRLVLLSFRTAPPPPPAPGAGLQGPAPAGQGVGPRVFSTAFNPAVHYDAGGHVLSRLGDSWQGVH